MSRPNMIEEVKLWIQFIRHPEESDYGCIPTVLDQERLCEAYLAALDENDEQSKLIDEFQANWYHKDSTWAELKKENERMKEVVEAARKKVFLMNQNDEELVEALYRLAASMG